MRLLFILFIIDASTKRVLQILGYFNILRVKTNYHQKNNKTDFLIHFPDCFYAVIVNRAALFSWKLKIQIVYNWEKLQNMFLVL